MEELEKCPYCGESMEQGYLIGARGIYWWPAGKPFPSSWRFIGESITPSANIKWLFGKGPHLSAYRCKKCRTILVRYLEETIQSEEPKAPMDLYGELLDSYTRVYGRDGRQLIDRKIESLMDEGLSREEAIRKLAEKEVV